MQYVVRETIWNYRLVFILFYATGGFVMADFTHKMARLAFSKAIDVMLHRLYKDREKGMLQIVDIV